MQGTRGGVDGTGLRAGSAARVVTEGMDTNATPGGTLCGVGAGRSRPASGCYLPSIPARAQPHPAAFHPPFPPPTEWGKNDRFQPQRSRGPARLRPGGGSTGSRSVSPGRAPPAPFGAVNESQILGGGTSFISERVRGGRRLEG